MRTWAHPIDKWITGLLARPLIQCVTPVTSLSGGGPMGPEWVAIIALVALFVVGTVLPINMGALGFVAAWLVGMYALGLSEREIIDGISGDLVLTLVGVTYLFAIARN